MSKVPFCHRVQTSPGISSEKPFWIQTIQVPEMQLQLCQQGKKYFFGNLAKSLRVAVMSHQFLQEHNQFSLTLPKGSEQIICL